ncbi:MAG: hypothetical protein JXC85_03150 [Candidatus Aenigmarchaeota archaeon]|nr:hypothetical protein [Candidatus Aenigmarchaeota archaeon]
MPDPRDLSTYRGMSIFDIDETSYRLVGTNLERKQALANEPDKYEVSLLCAMDRTDVQDMVRKFRDLNTEDKNVIHENLKEYMLADNHAKLPEMGLHLVGLLSENKYMQERHSWKSPLVLSNSIARIE